MASGAEEDVVVLVLTDPSDAAAESCAQEGEPEEITVSTSEIRSWDIDRILRCPLVRVRASRSSLIRESSYFRGLLGGSFSESGFNHVSIQCNLRAATSVLHCICGAPVDVQPDNFLLLLEGALFFGVEVLLSECKTWFQKMTTVRAAHLFQIPLDIVTEIWNYSLEYGISFISEICTAYLAQNFVWVIACSSFIDVPYDLLYSCLEHPDLTVCSEKQLCEALLLWITSNVKSSKCSCDSEKNYTSILKMVRFLFLPLAYSAGKRRSCCFSKVANESINAIFGLMEDFEETLSSAITDNDPNLKLRLTQYSEVSFAALGHVVRRNPGIRILKVIGCKNLYDTGGVVLRFNGDANCEDLYSELNQKCFLEEVSFGWGFSSSSMTKIKNALRGVRAMTLGLGTSLDLSLLPDICPFVETLILNFQVISDCDLIGILASLSHLKVLDLCCCLGDLTSKGFQISMTNLTSLRLERATPWMTNEDLVILTGSCPNLTELSLSGCKLLSSDVQRIISSGWPGLTVIHLEDCGNITSAGVSFLLDCVAIEDLLLRHNGRGIRRNIISDATRKLPLLRKVALDTCDACEGGFDSPSFAEKLFLSTVKIARCKPQRCSFDLRKLGSFRPVHKDTIVQVWNSKELRTTCVEERV